MNTNMTPALAYKTTTTPVQPRPNRSGDIAVAALIAVLRQLTKLLEAMSDEQYSSKPGGAVKSSIGGHVRHCLDHLDTLLTGIHTGVIDYDLRQRGTNVETCRRAALDAIQRHELALLPIARGTRNKPLRLYTTVNSSLPAIEVQTSVGREFAFVLSHTVHHNALIAVIASSLGIATPERFGYAPSTIAHMEKTACAR